MKYDTKKKRLCAIADGYSRRHQKLSYTIDEVSEWAVATGLYPTPIRGCPVEIAEAWERKLEEVSAIPTESPKILRPERSPICHER